MPIHHNKQQNKWINKKSGVGICKKAIFITVYTKMAAEHKKKITVK